jgi:hypothetical protein
MWHCAGLLQNDVSEEHVTSIYKIEEIMRGRKSVRLQENKNQPGGGTAL